ncbi:MAG: efflux RND transporter periplasmic adaptor subunit [Bacillota bacterium]
MVKKLFRSKLLVAVLVVAVVVAFWVIRSRNTAKPASTTYPLYEVKKGKLELAVTGSGNVSASERVTARAKVAGTVKEVLVKIGDQVTEGQPLVVLENQDVVNAFEQARLSLEATRVKYNDLTKAPTEGDIKAAEAKVAQARENLRQRKEELEDLQVKAPIAGALSQFSLDVGDEVTAGQQVAVVVDESVIKFNAAVYQADVSKIEVGRKATVVIGSDLAWSSTKAYEGIITNVAREGSGTGKNATFNVTIEIANVDGQLRAGMTGYLQSIEMGDETVLWPTITGSTSAKERKVVISKTGGKVKQVLANEGQLVSAGQVLAVLENGSVEAAVKDAEAALATAEENLRDLLSRKTVGTESEIAVQRTQLDQAVLNYNLKQRDVDELVVKAPCSGTVTYVAVKKGDQVSANAEMCAISNLSRLSLVVAVDELDVGKLKVGMAAEVTTQALPNKTFKATVTEIALEGTVKDGVASYDVTLELEEGALKGGLVPGMSADAKIITASKENVIAIPAEAVRSRAQRKYVYVLKDGQPQAVDVTVGMSSDSQVEITSGLQEGDKVILSNPEQSSRNVGPFMPGVPGGARPQSQSTSRQGGTNR